MNYFSVIVIVVLLFLGGDNVLEKLGYPHGDFSTSSFYRLHPLTYYAGGLFLFFLLVGQIRISDMIGRMKGELRLLVICIFCLAYLKVSGILSAFSFVLDALCLPAILSILLKVTDKKLLSQFRIFIYFIFYFNSIIAIFEKVTSRFLIGSEIAGFDYFRSTAMYGHPLNNALITSVLAVILFYHSKNNWSRIGVLVLSTLALMSFGSRGALMGLFLSIFLNIALNIVMPNLRQNKYSRINGGFIYMILLGLILFTFLNFTNLGDRIVAASHIDNSALARVESFEVLHGMEIKDLMWGEGNKEIEYLQHINNVEIIENFWIVWLLKFGLPLTLILSISLISFLYSVMESIKIDLKLIFLFALFFVASTNNSLSSNTLVISIFVLSSYILFDTSEGYLKGLVCEQS